MHPAEHDHLGGRAGCLPGEPKRIADEIGDILNFRPLVVVRENDGIPRLRQGTNFRRQRRIVVCFKNRHRGHVIGKARE